MCDLCLQTHTHLGRMAKVACAECLGMLGALDPSRVVVESLGKKTMILDETTLVTSLMKTHLVRLLRVAPSLQVLDATTFAIQVRRNPVQCIISIISPKAWAEMLDGALLQQETLATYRQFGTHGLSAAGQESNEGFDNWLFKSLPSEVQVSLPLVSLPAQYVGQGP